MTITLVISLAARPVQISRACLQVCVSPWTQAPYLTDDQWPSQEFVLGAHLRREASRPKGESGEGFPTS